MIRFACAVTVLLGGCAAKAPPEQIYLDPAPGAASIEPVALKDLRGRDVLIFPDIAPDQTAARLEDHLRRCRTADGSVLRRDPHGLSLIALSGDPRLTLMLARVSRSSAVGADGPDFSPEVKEELAQAVQGQSRCAAA